MAMASDPGIRAMTKCMLFEQLVDQVSTSTSFTSLPRRDLQPRRRHAARNLGIVCASGTQAQGLFHGCRQHISQWAWQWRSQITNWE